ncbi:ATP-dependent helicase Lhr and Lhr-like helicase [Paenibacillus sp. UNCCL117]|uniref:DEAD/DEAH box helicase n=1 Tax=unclassified Paenibacillus TaxID=185978 RepID=UPI00088ACD03|nr:MULTISPECIES: DEAD/DEAH box helicase [unclassified Paenibacillus]SDC25590.1 ATP dependent helicase, Lhr family [Paenibacillus sp. cl123]SFW19862.1 ATP-dependent helicase Lhr and Lhr-like helicase [Paenibacillus sp. UNCCL117]
MAGQRQNEAEFHPVLWSWFASRFGEPTDVQRQAWARIRSGQHTLISSPTGSGKTLAALLPCLDWIIRSKESAAAGYAPGVRTLVVTPLKALNNDIHHHLLQFLEEIQAEAATHSPGGAEGWRAITAGVRTGDTTQSTRASMLRTPPDVLVTTPESLYLLLTSPRAREILRTVEQVIVDEIHDLAADKRGEHLSLTLERLHVWCSGSVQRIGVSATQKPIERVARYLGGWESGQPRPVAIVESRADKQYSLLVTVPEPIRPGADREAIWTPLVQRLLQLMEGSRTVLVFANSRRLCERLTLRLNDHVGYEMVRSHHGSVAREKRLEVEQLLKEGKLRCLVATSSLELGIDVGHVDLVIQIDSPFSAAAGIQRIGRAGHSVGGVSRGALVARSRSFLPELAVLARRIAARDIEAIRIPRGGLDVLAQQVVAIVSLGDEWDVAGLERLLAASDSFRWVPRDRLLALLEMLAGFYPFVRPLIEWDRATDRLTRLAATPMAALVGAGTIPQSTAYPVHHNETGLHLGELDEEFVQESSVGDVFQLGTASWRIMRIRPERIYVREAENRYSEIPFWRGESGGKSYELGMQTGALWRELRSRLQTGHGKAEQVQPERMQTERVQAEQVQPDQPQADQLQTEQLQAEQLQSGQFGPMEAGAAEPLGKNRQTDADGRLPERSAVDAQVQEWLMAEYYLDAEAAASLIGFVRNQMAVAPVPTDRQIVIETFTDEQGHSHCIVHSLLGRRLNRTWLMSVSRKLTEAGHQALYTNARDNGFELVFSGHDASIVSAIRTLSWEQAEPLIAQAVSQSPMFGSTFQQLAETSLLLARSFTRMPAWKKRLRSQELLKEALPFRERFPLFQEAMRVCLEEQTDTDNLRLVLEAVRQGDIRFAEHRGHAPSPLAAQFQADYAQTRLYESDALPQDVQAELLGFSRSLAAEIFGDEAVRQAVHPEVLAAEERRLEHGDGSWSGPGDVLRHLKEHGEATAEELQKAAGEEAAQLPGWLEQLLVRGNVSRLALQQQTFYISSDERSLYASLNASAEARALILQRYSDHAISVTLEELMTRYALERPAAEEWLQTALAEGRMEASPFSDPGETGMWTSSKVASRLIRTSVQLFRRSSEAVPALTYLRHMPLFAGLATASPLVGSDRLRELIIDLEGFFLPVSLWESVLFPARLPGYKKQDLDWLCASGEVFWAGRKQPDEKEGRIAFFLAENSGLYQPYLEKSAAENRPSAHPELLRLLMGKGAAFLTKLSIETGKQPSVLLAELLELVWDGQAANDQFAPMRLHALGKAKKPDKFQSGLGRWYPLESLYNPGYDKEAAALAWIRHLLDKYGILTKELVASVSPYAWETVLPLLKQLEHWGTVVRGLFIRDLPYLQFASKDFLTRLYQSAAAPADAASAGEREEPLILLSAVDPANPFGLLIPWPQAEGLSFSRKPGNYMVFQGASWLYWIENNGKRIYQIERGQDGTQADIGRQLKEIFRLFLKQQQLRKIVVESWNGVRISEAPEREYLQLLGAEKDRSHYVLWPSQLG